MARTPDTDLSRAHIGMDLFGPAPDFVGLARPMGWWAEGPSRTPTISNRRFSGPSRRSSRASLRWSARWPSTDEAELGRMQEFVDARRGQASGQWLRRFDRTDGNTEKEHP
jgi:hypothetical protein